MNHSTILRCGVEGKATSVQTWRFQAIGSDDDEVIFVNSAIRETFKTVIRATRTECGHVELLLIRASINFAGTYYCFDNGNTREQQLIILGKKSFSAF